MENNRQAQLYSQKAIGIATFFGGPLAAGILVRRNYINLGNDLYGKHALSVGIISTILLFTAIFSMPEHILDKIPNSLVPAIYTFVIFLVVEKLQGQVLKKHNENNGTFYSAWRATGVGFLCMLVIVAGILGYAYKVGSDFDTEEYDRGLAEIQQNEEAHYNYLVLVEMPVFIKLLTSLTKKEYPIGRKTLLFLTAWATLKDSQKNSRNKMKSYDRIMNYEFNPIYLSKKQH